jgi:chemotaxis protein methyltransferase CheR
MHDLSHIHFSGNRDGAVASSSVWPKPLYDSPDPFSSLAPPSAGRLEPFIASVLTRSGLDAEAYRANALERRLPAVLRRLRVTTVAAAAERLDREPNLLPEVLGVFLIGVTGFFRDPPVFENLRDKFLPAMIRRRVPLRILCAGVSAGHEMYSVAMLMAEAGILEKSLLLGIDCRAEAIARAQDGSFTDEEMQQLPRMWRDRYFEASAVGWTAQSSLRESLQWRIENLLRHVPQGPWDVVFFRNVAIYLEGTAANSVWRGLHENLAGDGLLVTGKADQPPPSLPFTRLAPSIYKANPHGN